MPAKGRQLDGCVDLAALCFQKRGWSKRRGAAVGGRLLAALMLAGAVAAGAVPWAVVPAVAQQPDAAASGAVPAAAAPSTGLQAAMALEDVLVKAIAHAERSVVAIACVHREDRADQLELRQDLFGLGGQRIASPSEPDFIPNDYATGVVVDAKGLILTAQHALREHCDYWVTTANRKTYKVVQIKGADPRSDLAVLSIQAQPGELTPIQFGDASALKKGQIVIALGNPYAIARDGQVSASWGIVSNLNRKDGPWPTDREVPSPKPTLHHYGTLIQTDAKLNLGTSGGALLNLKGEMVGLTISLAAGVGYEQSAGFALSVDETFRRAVETLKQGQEVEYGLLGVEPKFRRWEDQAKEGRGVLVQRVVPGSPADRFGLRDGDVVSHINGREVLTPDELMLYIGSQPPDAPVQLIVRRGNAARPVTVQELAKLRVWGRKIVTNPPAAWRGIRIDYVTASRDYNNPERRRLANPFDPGGAPVIITEVNEDSPAWREGLRPEMLISHVAGVPVTSPRHFRELVASRPGPIKLRLLLPSEERLERTIDPTDAGDADAGKPSDAGTANEPG